MFGINVNGSWDTFLCNKSSAIFCLSPMMKAQFVIILLDAYATLFPITNITRY